MTEIIFVYTSKVFIHQFAPAAETDKAFEADVGWV